MTSFGGGLKGTGVPFILIKCRIDHSIRNNPIVRTGADRMIFNDVGRSLGNFKNLSNWRETMTNSTIMVKKKISPTGVRRLLILLLPVAAL